MNELPYTKELLTIALTALFSFAISYAFFKRQNILEKSKILHDTASVTVIKYIDELILILSELSYTSNKADEDKVRANLIDTIKKHQDITTTRLLLIEDEKLVNDFDLFLNACSVYSQRTGFSMANDLPVTFITVPASTVLKKLL
ncbi:hypothetical protein [Pseudoalteromonas arabiensis]|uniref:hypothetical protein n=1 Tax=Pseudoalteromonas arabiensis TaxID=874454 RepID=UPI000783CB2D|nr:hypothetical protein [Pseudoalteromonas arabiensis]